MVGAHHHVHAQQGGDDELIELALLEAGVVALQPLARLHHNDEGAESQDGLDDTDGRARGIHAAKGGGGLRGEDVDEDVGHEHHAHQRVEPAAVGGHAGLGCREKVGQKDDNQHGHQRDLGYHVEELTIIDMHNSVFGGYIPAREPVVMMWFTIGPTASLMMFCAQRGNVPKPATQKMRPATAMRSSQEASVSL